MQDHNQPAQSVQSSPPHGAGSQPGIAPIAPTAVTLDIHDVTIGQTTQEVSQHG
jgi:hypothetical protein